jgi:SagB-type dehydrogenase family enzyme
MHLSLRPGIALTAGEPGTILVRDPKRGDLKLADLPAPVWTVLLTLREGPLVHGPSELSAEQSARLDTELSRLAGQRLIELSCRSEEDVLMTGILTTQLAAIDFSPVGDEHTVRLSRFAYARRWGDNLVVESPRSGARVTITHPALAGLLAALSRPATVGQVSRRVTGVPPDAAADCVRLLVRLGIAGTLDAGGRLQEDTDDRVVQREFHEVTAHAWSRTGLIDQATGATYPFDGTIPPAPAVKPMPSATTVPLPAPDLDRLVREDPPLAEVMERRRTVRRFGDPALSIEELGEFLFRVARVRAVNPIDRDAGRPYEWSNRPYPSGGGTYDLEFYLTVWACRGVPSGFYHYDPVEHSLSLVCDRVRSVVGMLNHAYHAAGGIAVPQVLITLASRFSRLTWKYRGISYVTTLKNVGVLYQSMYLAATAMGLAPCGIGGGNSALFSEITGIDPLVESSVGEFAIGSLPTERPA